MARTTIVTVEGIGPNMQEATRKYLQSFEKERLSSKGIKATELPSVYADDGLGWIHLVRKIEVTSQLSPKTRALLQARNIRV